MTRSSVPWKSARTLPSADSTVEDWAAGRAAGSGTLPMNRAKTATAPAAKPAAALGAAFGALAPAAGLRRGGSDRDWPATGMHRLLGLRSSGALGPGPRWPGLCADNSCENLQEVGPQPRDRQLPHHTEGNDQQGVPEPQPAKLRPRR